MGQPADSKKYESWLMELVGLPTAAGYEDRVRSWIRAWARRRRRVSLHEDRYGNIELRRTGIPSPGNPVYFTAHMDHPAFVVRDVADSKVVIAEFRGGVSESYFPRSKVLLHHSRVAPQRGTVRCRAADVGAESDGKGWDIHFPRPVRAAVGDILTWDIGPPRIVKGRLHGPACDDLAGLAAAISAFDRLLAIGSKDPRDIRVLLTRAEEIGFVGAMAAVKARTIPRTARLITLECSKSFADSPIGAGPIVRVGDRTSTFNPALTYHVGTIAAECASQDASFRWQRKLMPGGTCEASAYQAFGFAATCLCLPLGNYHNMNDSPTDPRIVAEVISLSDFQDLVRLLVAIGSGLDETPVSASLRSRLTTLFAQRRNVLRPLG